MSRSALWTAVAGSHSEMSGLLVGRKHLYNGVDIMLANKGTLVSAPTISPHTQKQRVLLTTADRQLDGITHGMSIRESLDDAVITAVLFHEGAVLPDIFAFISSALASARADGQPLLIERALEAGYVFPALRGSCKSFSESLKEIQGQGIAGVQVAPRTVADRLDESLSKAKSLKIENWPSDMSERYFTRTSVALRTIAMSDALTFDGRIKEKSGLPLTASFIRRFNFLEEVEKIGSTKFRGLRRGDYYDALLAALNKIVSSDKLRVADAHAELLSHPACGDAVIRTAVENLLVIGNSCYHVNMSECLGASSYLPGRIFTPETIDAMGVAILKNSDSAGLNSAGTAHFPASDTISVVIPCSSQLRAVPWAELLAIREEAGTAYFSALRNAESSPDEFEHCLRGYAKALSSRVKVAAPLTKVLLSKLSPSDRDATSKFVDWSLSAAKMVPGVNILLISPVSQLLTISYSWLSERQVKFNFSESPESAIVV